MGFVDNTVKKKQELVFFFEFIFFVLTFHHVTLFPVAAAVVRVKG